MQRKYFVQFLDDKYSYDIHKGPVKTGEVCDALGSDGVFILDGRNSIDTMVQDAMNRMKNLLKIKSFRGFEIRVGTFSKFQTLYTFIDGFSTIKGI